jgi:hypothetical protein
MVLLKWGKSTNKSDFNYTTFIIELYSSILDSNHHLSFNHLYWRYDSVKPNRQNDQNSSLSPKLEDILTRVYRKLVNLVQKIADLVALRQKKVLKSFRKKTGRMEKALYAWCRECPYISIHFLKFKVLLCI